MMKVSLLIFGLLYPCSILLSQEKSGTQPFRIRDTVNIIFPGEYYLIPRSGDNGSRHRVIRRINNNFQVIKGNHIDASGRTYYLLDDSWKFSSRLSSANKLRPTGRHFFSIRYSPDSRLEPLLDDLPVEIIRRIDNANILIIRSTFDLIENVLAPYDGVEYIDLLDQRPVEESPIRQFNPDVNRISTAWHHYPDLQGENIMISLKENSINTEDIDIAGKVTLDEHSSTEFTQHALEMGTLIAGAGHSFKTGKGVIQKANLLSTDFSSLFAEDESYYSANNVNVQNHSYGTDIENYYATESISYDQVSVDIPELVHVFSSGNAGMMAPGGGTYVGVNGYANLTGNFKQAKNVLVISSLDSSEHYVPLTSSGPAYDGRVKPELSAFGGEGSSEAAALVSGCAAMLQNQYANINGNFPASSLIKSLLIAGAKDVHTSGIDFKTGYGSVNLYRSLQALDSGWYFEGVLDSDDLQTFPIFIPEQTAELKVVLSWIDPPSQPENVTALVNDLDLTVTTPDNSVILPWILDTTPDEAALSAAATQGEDHLNNVEMISVENPGSGLYQGKIISHTLAGANQSFSVAYMIKPKNQFVWSFPTASDHLEAGTHPIFRWESTFPDQQGDLFIKYGNGGWEPLGPVDLTEELFRHTLRDTTQIAALKMEIAGVDYISNNFTITRLLELKVENDCQDEFILSWPRHENTDHYVLYELQANEMVPVHNTADTLVKLNKAEFQGKYFALKPVQTPGMDGLRSYAVNYENRNQGCYITNFLAYLDADPFVNIRLSVNVPHEIQSIVILKAFRGVQEVWQQFSPGGNTFFAFEDHDLMPGMYSYTAQLTLQDGRVVPSETISLYYTEGNTIIVFPNPVQDNFVNIVNVYPDGEFQLIDMKGSFVRSYVLGNYVDTLDLTGLTQGIYLFRIIYDGRIVNSGKIIVL